MPTKSPSLLSLLTRKQAAETLGVSVVTLWRIVVRGEMPTVHVGARVMFDPNDLAEYIERNKRLGGGDR